MENKLSAIMPLVSIVIPVYNGSNFMSEAIDSALAQTYPNIEILVVNDGSTDDTRKIALSYGDRIRYFEKENGGVATALNLAIREMRGAYFSWLSHDDWYTPDKVAAEIEALRACGDWNRAVFSECDFVQYPSGTRRRTDSIRFGQKRAETGWFTVAMGLISGCTLLIPKAYFDEFGGFDESVRAVNDYEQWFRMFRDKQMVYVGKSLVGSRVHEKQVTSTYQGMSKEEDDLWAWIMEGLQNIDVEACGLTLYQIYGLKLGQYARPQGYERVKRVLVEYLKKCEEPDGVEAGRQVLRRKRLTSVVGCYVYCAGRVARRFLSILRWRGLAVDGVSDSNPSVWGTEIEGVRCIPPAELPRDAKVIVANAYPDAVVAQLREQGFTDVDVFDDSWDYDLLMAPIKKSCCEVLQ